MIAAKGQNAISTGQASRAEAAIQTEWPVHIEAEPRVRGREAVQRMAVVNSYHHQTNKATDTRIPTVLPLVACLALQPSFGR